MPGTMAAATHATHRTLVNADTGRTRGAESGVRLMIQLAAQFAEHPEVRYGLTAMCIGLGQGGSVIWENPNYDGKK